MSNEIHVIPVPDAEEHEEDESCKCDPKEEKVGTTKVFIHKPSDGREYCKIKPNKKKWSKPKFVTT
jgi:hypothetical protein